MLLWGCTIADIWLTFEASLDLVVCGEMWLSPGMFLCFFLHHVVVVLVICVHYFVSYIEFKHSVNRLLAFEHLKKIMSCFITFNNVANGDLIGFKMFE